MLRRHLIFGTRSMIVFRKIFNRQIPKPFILKLLKWYSQTRLAPTETSVNDLNVVSVMETSTDSNKTNDSSTTDKQRKYSLRFKVELSYKVWKTISSVNKNYRRKRVGNIRTYVVLKPGVWTNVILDAVTKKRRDIPCA